MTEFNIYEELMPKIQALISPPDNGNFKEKSGDIYPYFKKRGKRHNHDYCDACGGKGNVICCDICPASFHLICLDPPLKETEITNCWSCPACKFMVENEQDSFNNSYSDHSIVDEDTYVINEKIADNVILSKSKCNNKNSTIDDDNVCFLDGSDNVNQQKYNKSIDSYNKIENFESKKSNINSQKHYQEKNEDIFHVNNEGNSRSSDVCGELSKNLNNFEEFNKVTAEPQSCENSDSSQDTKVDVDVWKIIGISKNTKINGNKKYNDHSSKEIISDAKKRIRKEELDECDTPKHFKHRDFNIKLPNCDYLVKKLCDASNDFNKNINVSFNSLRNIKRSKKRIISSDEDINATFPIIRIFDDIIAETKKVNPRQFTLPNEYIQNINMNIVGSEKDQDGSLIDLDSNDIIKIPPRRCYYCKGICLTGQMVSCDFCPAHFHLNCLNPPLCNIPDTRWMCPLHPHHILKKIMKNSSSITELMIWWNKLSAPVDDDDVKLKFMQKINSSKNKSSKQKLIRTAVNIPDIVKYHYKYPPMQVPTLQEIVCSESDCSFEKGFLLSSPNEVKKSNNCCDDAMESNNTELQCQIAESQKIDDKSTEIGAEINCFNSQEKTEEKRNSSLTEISDDHNIQDLADEEQKSQYDDLSIWDEENKKFKFTSCGIYDYESLKGILNINKIMKETPWQKIENIILRDIDRNFIINGVFATKLDNNLKRFLAKEKLNQLTKEFPPTFFPNSNPYPFFAPWSNKNNILPENTNEMIHAVLCPLSHHAPPVFMCGSTLSVGCGFSNDVCLLNYGKCNFISEEHAVIFYDENTNTYELLNYSHFSTVVDGICYTCDISNNKFFQENDLNIVNNNNDNNTNKIKTKVTGSTVMAAETRSIYKKLLHNIDELVTKSQKEMASIAEEDLNEISKAMKTVLVTNAFQRDSGIDKQKTKKKGDTVSQSKRNKERKNLKDNSETDEVSVLKLVINKSVDKDITEPENHLNTTTDTTKIPSNLGSIRKLVPQRKSKDAAVVLDLSDTIAVRRTKRNVKRSIFTPLRRERKKQKIEASKQPPDEEKRKEEMNNISLTANNERPDNNDDHLSSNDFYFCGKNEKCKCQIKDIKFPNGRDGSWEKTASLFHGSYIRFGCIEFVFSIINYPSHIENRIYNENKKSQIPFPNSENEEKTSSTVTPEKKGEELPLLTKSSETTKDDLSMKLISILNVLSKSSNSSSSRSPSVSNASSTRTSRSSSPTCSLDNEEENDCNSRYEINHENSEVNKCETDGSPR